MLIELRVENHRSIREEQVLTLEAADIHHPAGRTQKVDGHAKELLRCAALYGANASGKSNVLRALYFMCRAVRDSQNAWSPTAGVPRTPFGWGEWKTKDSLFEVTVVLDGVRYQYGFVVDDQRFSQEWLVACSNGQEQLWFERDGDEVAFGDAFRGERHILEQLLRPNALLLSLAAQLNHEQTRPLRHWFAMAGGVGLDLDSGGMSSFVMNNLSSKEVEPLVATFGIFLQFADVGILGCEAREGPSGQKLWLQHADAPDAWLPLEEESRGTQALAHLLPALVLAMGNGSLLIIDELENNFHPTLARQLVRFFQAPERAFKGQVLFSTHDATLLGTAAGEAVLSRDQVWMTEKAPSGATVLLPLTDYKAREGENVERSYLQGRYGGVPHLGELALAFRDVTE